MDPHFNEYLAAIAGMHDVYGDKPHDHPTEFHEERVIAALEESAVVATVD